MHGSTDVVNAALKRQINDNEFCKLCSEGDMKTLTKIAMVMGMAGASLSAAAANVNFIYDGASQGNYAYNDMTVASDGTITVDLLSAITGQPQDYCGTDTTWNGQECIGSGGGQASCGTGTVLEGNECVVDQDYLTPPTVSIGSSPASLGDGVTSSVITFQFSRAVTGFALSDVSVSPSNHTLSGFTAVDGDTFRATLNRSGNGSGSVSVSVTGSYQGTNGVSGGSGSRSITLVGGSTNIGNCEVPAGVDISGALALTKFGSNTGLMDFKLPRSPDVLSHGFTTTGDDSNGQINMGGDSGTSADIRDMWISKCPGGAALSSSCKRSGNLTTLRWKQKSSRTSCELDKNSTYYFNVKAESCNRSGGCSAIIQHLGGW